jgi:uncharacterized protein
MSTVGDNKMMVVAWDEKYEQQALALLKKYEETSLFLLENLKTYGSKLTTASYSANYKCLVEDDEVVAVFALTRIGNLLLQTDRKREYAAMIVAACLQEPIALRGVVGAWDIAQPIWNFAKNKITALKETFAQQEILFALDLQCLPVLQEKHMIRYLNSSDYMKWSSLNKEFLSALNIDQGEDEIAMKQRFIQASENQCWFGLFVDNELVAMASFLACIDNVGQIGGVCTTASMRKQGLSKELISRLILDGKVNKNLKKIILFTGINNTAAIGLYEGLGFKRIGYFGLLFGELINGKECKD